MISRPCLAQPVKQPCPGVTKFSKSLDNSLNMFSRLNSHNTLHVVITTEYNVKSCASVHTRILPTCASLNKLVKL